MPRTLPLLCAFLLAAALPGADLDQLTACTVMVGNGSGVLVSADGLVLTNHHVAGELERPAVRLADGRSLPARQLGSDPVGDITLLRIAAPGPFPYASLRDLPPPPVGSPVVAVGNPFGLGDLDDRPSLAFGVLSTAPVARGNYPDCLVHDAPVNPGNSGGPLFSAGDGRLLGINGQIRSRSGLRINSGIGLAISAAQLALFAPRLESTPSGLVHRTALPAGVELAEGADGPRVAAAGPGELRAGDRLLAVAGRPTASAISARALFTALPWSAGARVPVRVERAGAVLDLAVTAGRSPIPGRPWHGLAVAERAGYLATGAVAEDSPAAQAGIKEGERLVSANDQAVRERTDWLRALAGLEVGDRLTLVLAGAGGERRCQLWLRAAAE